MKTLLGLAFLVVVVALATPGKPKEPLTIVTAMTDIPAPTIIQAGATAISETKPIVPDPRQIKIGLRMLVLAVLKDPASAQFGSTFIGRKDHGCVMVNARNGFGGYTGMQPFVITKKGVNANDARLWNKYCAGVTYTD